MINLGRQAFRMPDSAVADHLSQLWLQAVLSLILVLALTLGAGNRGRELTILALQLAAAAALPAAVWRLGAKPERRDPLALVVLGAILTAPLVQLIPLPVSLWTSLPGRDLALQTLTLAGVAPSAHALSLTPDATYSAFLWLWPAAAVLLGAMALDSDRLGGLFLTALAMLVLGALLEGLQYGTHLQFRWPPHPFSNQDFPIGFFANRNHQAVAMAIGLPLAGALAQMGWSGWRHRLPPGLIAYFTLTVLFTACIVATRSRSGFVLGLLGLVLGGVILLQPFGKSEPGRARYWVLAATICIMVIGGATSLGAVMARFGNIDKTEQRLETWPTILAAAGKFQPVGSGLGSFDPVYRSVERPEMVNPRYLNEAHNDYLQLWLETGIIFPIVLVAFLAWLAMAGVRAILTTPPLRSSFNMAALSGVIILMIHSFVDYPLRTQAMTCVFALFCGAMTAGHSDQQGRMTRRRPFLGQ